MKAAVTLKKNHEFRRLYQKGASAAAGNMVLYCRKNRLGRNRVGFTVSVKLGGAVKRNRARRRLREVYRLNSPRLSQGWDIILVARGRTLTAPWRELNDSFLRLARKLDLLRDSRKGPGKGEGPRPSEKPPLEDKP
nr:ribonuclease P protein component [uncultured Oscillibacter sp.]